MLDFSDISSLLTPKRWHSIQPLTVSLTSSSCLYLTPDYWYLTPDCWCLTLTLYLTPEHQYLPVHTPYSNTCTHPASLPPSMVPYACDKHIIISFRRTWLKKTSWRCWEWVCMTSRPCLSGSKITWRRSVVYSETVESFYLLLFIVMWQCCLEMYIPLGPSIV